MPDAQPATILIVDDAQLNRVLLERQLSKQGHRFFHAGDGREATKVLSAHHEIDLILLDLVMPVMDGFQFLRWRRTNLDANSVPVIVNSSLDDFDSIVRALHMGSHDYFTKPLSAHDLNYILPLKIRNAVNTKRLMDETRRQNDLMKADLEMASRYQEFLLPDYTDLPGAKVTYLFQPCSGVGGDYFDFFELANGKLGFVVADVSGHGVASAMTASIVKALLPGYLENLDSPAGALGALNEDLVRLTQEDSFVSCFAALYDPDQRRLAWSTAGHPPSLHTTPAGGHPVQLSAAAMFLGAFSGPDHGVVYEDHTLDIGPGDRLAMYTDGLTEVPNQAGEQFGIDRLEKLLIGPDSRDIEEIRDKVWDTLVEFSCSYFPDDVAFILVEF